MTRYLFRQVFFPYALDRQPDGTYVITNRQYKPLGFAVPSRQMVEYADFPVRVKLRMTKAKAKALSYSGSDDVQRIYLYNDGCTPEASKRDWDMYCARLHALLKMKVELLE